VLHAIKINKLSQFGFPDIYSVKADVLTGRAEILMKCYGPNLKQVFCQNMNFEPTVEIVSSVCTQILERCQMLHKIGFMHCDLKL
jgi:serine/threonine protein kinase